MGNRIIKLQFWINDESRMIDSVGHCYESDTQIRIWYRNDGRLYNESFAVHNVSSRENCGLKDKNGVEIYEGDVVRVWTRDKEGYDYDGTVVYDKAAFYVDFAKQDFPFVPNLSQWVERTEVLGNIYQNPELLNL